MLALVIQKLTRPSLRPQDAHNPVRGDKQMNYDHAIGKSYYKYLEVIRGTRWRNENGVGCSQQRVLENLWSSC